ncbi:MAG: TolC family protein, partial [Candidatus Omnitrophica bacterium]|nr:TolC family protein [Candidatus Omnitrophota bacterium]
MKKFSKNTLKLLRFFYSHPQEQFYIQQLGRLLKKKPGVFQRALYSLEKEGVLKSDYKANARFFSVNTGYLFYEEFKSIVKKMHNLTVAIILAFTFLLLSVSDGPCSEKGPEAIVFSSLKSAIEIAFKNNKDIKINEYELKVASADILGARSAFLPNVDFNAGYQH